MIPETEMDNTKRGSRTPKAACHCASADDRLQRLHIDTDTNVFELDSADPDIQALRMTPHAIEKFICGRNITVANKGRNIEMLYEQCVIKRGLVSQIPFDNGRVISSRLPPRKTVTYILQMTDEEYDRHMPLHNAQMSNLGHYHVGAARVIFRAEYLRRLCHLAFATKLDYLPRSVLNELKKYRDNPKFDLRALANLICKHANAEVKEGSPMELDEPGPSLDELLAWFADGSPKLRFLSYYAAELIVKKKEKAVFFVGSPWPQLLTVLVSRNS
jgi:hypothetical protein